jgi:hypothetical protein
MLSAPPELGFSYPKVMQRLPATHEIDANTDEETPLSTGALATDQPVGVHCRTKLSDPTPPTAMHALWL